MNDERLEYKHGITFTRRDGKDRGTKCLTNVYKIMNGIEKMDGELLLPGDQLQNKKTLNATDGGETLSQLKEMLLTPSVDIQ